MPAYLVSQQALAEEAIKHPEDLLLTQIKDTHCSYFSATKPAKIVGFLCMLFDECLEWASTHGHSILIKHPVEKLLKKVVEEIMIAVPEYYATVINDAAFNGAKSLAAPYKAEMANFVQVNMAGKSFPYNQPRDGFHTMIAYRGSSTHSVVQDMMSNAAQNLPSSSCISKRNRTWRRASNRKRS